MKSPLANPTNQRLFHSGQFSDVTLEIEGKPIACHRSVLAASPLFETQFNSDFADGKDTSPIPITTVGYDTMHKFVSYLYGYDIEVSGDDIWIVFVLADMHRVLSLRDACFNILFKHIKGGIAIELWRLAKLHECDENASKCRKWCVSNFDKCSGTMLECDTPELVEELLSHSELKIPSESDVMNVIIDWVLHKRGERVKRFAELFDRCVRKEWVDGDAVLRKIARLQLADEEKLMLFNAISRIERGLDPNVMLSARSATDQIESLTVCVSTTEMLVMFRYSGPIADTLNMFNCKFMLVPVSKNETLLFDFSFNSEGNLANIARERGSLIREIYDFSCGEWQDSLLDCLIGTDDDDRYFERSNVLRLPNSRYLVVYRDAFDNSHVLHLKKFLDSSPWTEDYHVEVPIVGLQSCACVAYYAERVFLFDCERSLILVFDAQNAELLRRVSANMFQSGDSYTIVAIKQNIVCLVNCDGVCLLDLNDILESSAEEKSCGDGEPTAKKRKRNQSATSLDVTVKRFLSSEFQNESIDSAAIYHNQLVVTYRLPMTKRLSVYAVELKTLLDLPDGGSMTWRKVRFEIGDDAIKHLKQLEDPYHDTLTIQVFASSIKNPKLLAY